MSIGWDMKLAEPYGQQRISYGNVPYTTATSLDIKWAGDDTRGNGGGMTTIMEMASFLDDPVEIVGYLLPTVGLPPERVQLELMFRGMNRPICKIDGTPYHVYDAHTHVQADEPTRVELILRMSDVPVMIKGSMMDILPEETL